MNPVNHKTNCNCILLTDYIFLRVKLVDTEYDPHTYLYKLYNARYHLAASLRESVGVLRGFS
jgi:hypothetical protein